MWQNAVSEEPFITESSSLARLSGDESFEQVINGQLEMSEFVEGWLEGLRAFDALRQPYLLYPVQR